MRTGDLGILDKQGNIYIHGRSKNMILGPSGQNIYPEEIEDKINSMPGVVESIVVDRDHKLVALIFPENPGDNNVVAMMEAHRVALNKQLPQYSQIASVEVVPQEFEKTPKKSIKRFLYS
jgi:long-chain acyl-CoA synthetase